MRCLWASDLKWAAVWIMDVMYERNELLTWNASEWTIFIQFWKRSRRALVYKVHINYYKTLVKWIDCSQFIINLDYTILYNCQMYTDMMQRKRINIIGAMVGQLVALLPSTAEVWVEFNYQNRPGISNV